MIGLCWSHNVTTNMMQNRKDLCRWKQVFTLLKSYLKRLDGGWNVPKSFKFVFPPLLSHVPFGSFGWTLSSCWWSTSAPALPSTFSFVVQPPSTFRVPIGRAGPSLQITSLVSVCILIWSFKKAIHDKEEWRTRGWTRITDMRISLE